MSEERMSAKEIVNFSFREGFKDVEQFVNAELEKISPYLSRIIKAFYDLNWGKDLDENLPEVQFTMPFKSGMPTGGTYARVFEFEFYTDSSECFHLYVNEFKHQDMEVVIASVVLKFSDWLEAGDR